YAEAQRILSELQADLRKALDQPGTLSVEERYAYDGFYAFGQADYDGAVTAWAKTRAVIQQAAATPQAQGSAVQALHFEAYEKVAWAHVEEEKRTADMRALFERGMLLYQKEHYTEAMDVFRQLAIENPDYPQLGFYLVQAEAAAEKDRTRRLGERKREQVAALFKQGVDQLEKEHYEDAERSFQDLLAIDPTHSEARSYLTMVKAEMSRRHDPKAAQMHYEAGLVDYASGKLEDALREWRVAIRMDPRHEKALNALSKVQKELALNKDPAALP